MTGVMRPVPSLQQQGARLEVASLPLLLLRSRVVNSRLERTYLLWWGPNHGLIEIEAKVAPEPIDPNRHETVFCFGP